MSAFTAVNVREEQAPQDLWSGAEPTEENPDGEYPPVAEEPMDEDEAVADHEDEDEDDDDAAVSEDERDVDDDQADDDDDQVDHGVLEDDSEPEIDIDESLDMDDSFVDDQALDGARPPPELVVSTENVQRFKARITHILKGIKTVIDEMDPFNEKWEGHYDWTNAPVTFRFWDFLRRVSVEVLFDCILKGASPQVKHVLGKLRWTLQDLSSLPPASAQTEKGIYTGIVLTSSNIDNYDVYVGSSLRSVARRVREHVSAMRQADAPSTATMNSKRDLEGDDSSSPDPVQKRSGRESDEGLNFEASSPATSKKDPDQIGLEDLEGTTISGLKKRVGGLEASIDDLAVVSGIDQWTTELARCLEDPKRQLTSLASLSSSATEWDWSQPREENVAKPDERALTPLPLATDLPSGTPVAQSAPGGSDRRHDSSGHIADPASWNVPEGLRDGTEMTLWIFRLILS
ncbi:MAG: hypothetical protein M1817_006316 [Caeruleum heppii]|nr:MAG: hypothetical protein M1817_006316 [Caeruleum heppii]